MDPKVEGSEKVILFIEQEIYERAFPVRNRSKMIKNIDFQTLRKWFFFLESLQFAGLAVLDGCLDILTIVVPPRCT